MAQPLEVTAMRPYRWCSERAAEAKEDINMGAQPTAPTSTDSTIAICPHHKHINQQRSSAHMACRPRMVLLCGLALGSTVSIDSSDPAEP